jgi:DNA-binding response OmpR family regulator
MKMRTSSPPAVRTTIKKLRHKLGEPDLIKTLIDSGYRIPQ